MIASAECHRAFSPHVAFGPSKGERRAPVRLSAGTRPYRRRSITANRTNLDAARSERNPRGQDYVVVVFLMIRHRDLVAGAERQADAVVNRNPPDQKSRA